MAGHSHLSWPPNILNQGQVERGVWIAPFKSPELFLTAGQNLSLGRKDHPFGNIMISCVRNSKFVLRATDWNLAGSRGLTIRLDGSGCRGTVCCVRSAIALRAATQLSNLEWGFNQ